MVKLKDYQVEAVKKMKNGCILCGGVGSGKSLTALSYYLTLPKMPMVIITTARKRDTHEWENDISKLGKKIKDVTIDSWNNIKKHSDVKGAFFIFDEQRLVGSGAWVKAFLKIAKSNKWILLSATPGDTWMDYIPVFIANGFYKNRTEFIREHVVYKRFTKFPMVDRYLGQGKLLRFRREILVNMDFHRETVSHHEDIFVDYDPKTYREISKTRWNPWNDTPIKNASEYCYCLRRNVNTSSSRQVALLELLESHPKCIIFYNFDYELEILRELGSNFYPRIEIAEWNGHKHQPIPDSDRWIYLVQYTAGAEGWNCVETNTIIFYSQNYSYKVMVQASGRIDRMNTPFTDLYYYHLKSRSSIDIAIARALKEKKEFNESKFYTHK